jgi:Cdc6-like AAA superfamily ATPase
MPTQQEIDDVLTKVADYQTKKADSDAAQRVVDFANQRASAARVAFDAMVADGETDEAKLTSVLVAVSETGLDAAAKQEDAQAKSNLMSSARTQYTDAVTALTVPPPPP